MPVYERLSLVDLRAEDFTSLNELKAKVEELHDEFLIDHPDSGMAVLLSLSQQKRLRFERYQKGVPLKQVKQDILAAICDCPVVTTEYETGCPNCGDMAHWQ